MEESGYNMILRKAGNLVYLTKENPIGESKTIPDQSISVREILHRYTTGQSLDVNMNVPVYTEGDSLYDVRRKHNIDLAIDRYENERIIDELDQKGAGYERQKLRLSKMESDQAGKSQGGADMGQSSEKVQTEPPVNS